MAHLLALPASILFLVAAFSQGPVRRLDIFGRKAVSATSRTANKQILVSASETGLRRDVLRLRAEAAFQKATLLRENQTGTNLTAAVGLLRKSAQLFLAVHLYEKAADAYFHAGQIYFTFGQYDKARRFYRQALKLGQDPEVRCRALSRIARTYASTRPYSLADRYSTQALKLCEGLSEEAKAEALEARGEALDFAGERSKSEAYFLEARDLFAIAKDKDGQAQALLMLAYGALFSGGKQVQGS